MVWSQKGGRLSGRGLSDRLNTYDDDPDTCRRRRRRRGRVAQNVWPLHTMALGGEGYAIRAASFSCVGYLWILPPYCIDGVALDDVSQSRQYTIGGVRLGKLSELANVRKCQQLILTFQATIFDCISITLMMFFLHISTLHLDF